MARNTMAEQIMVLAVCFLTASASANGQDSAPCSQSVGFATSKWAEAKPARRPIEVIAANQIGWLGINHVAMSGESVRHSLRSLLPWANPRYVQAYPFPQATETLANRNPVLYLHIADLASSIDELASKVTLARMQVEGDHRLLRVTSGAFSWNARREVDKRDQLPLSVKPLREDFAEIKAKRPLENGEYILLLSQSAGEGFEFRMDCR